MAVNGIVYVPIFYGDDYPDLETWLSWVDAYTTDEGYDDFDKERFAYGFVEEDALTWFDEENSKSPFDSWSELKFRMRQRFSKDSEVVIGSDLKQMVNIRQEKLLDETKEYSEIQNLSGGAKVKASLIGEVDGSDVIESESKESVEHKEGKQSGGEYALQVFDKMILRGKTNTRKKKKRIFTKTRRAKYKGGKGLRCLWLNTLRWFEKMGIERFIKKNLVDYDIKGLERFYEVVGAKLMMGDISVKRFMRMKHKFRKRRNKSGVQHNKTKSTLVKAVKKPLKNQRVRRSRKVEYAKTRRGKSKPRIRKQIHFQFRVKRRFKSPSMRRMKEGKRVMYCCDMLIELLLWEIRVKKKNLRVGFKEDVYHGLLHIIIKVIGKKKTRDVVGYMLYLLETIFLLGVTRKGTGTHSKKAKHNDCCPWIYRMYLLRFTQRKKKKKRKKKVRWTKLSSYKCKQLSWEKLLQIVNRFQFKSHRMWAAREAHKLERFCHKRDLGNDQGGEMIWLLWLYEKKVIIFLTAHKGTIFVGIVFRVKKGTYKFIRFKDRNRVLHMERLLQNLNKNMSATKPKSQNRRAIKFWKRQSYQVGYTCHVINQEFCLRCTKAKYLLERNAKYTYKNEHKTTCKGHMFRHKHKKKVMMLVASQKLGVFCDKVFKLKKQKLYKSTKSKNGWVVVVNKNLCEMMRMMKLLSLLVDKKRMMRVIMPFVGKVRKSVCKSGGE